MTTPATAPQAPAPPGGGPLELLKSRSYVALLVFGAIIGVPVAATAYFFLKLVDKSQQWLFTTFPNDVGFHGEPTWWPVPLLVLSGLLVGLTIRYLPGTGGHKPAEGFKPAGATPAIELPGIVIAALATLCLGAVLGPEAPLIAIGAGLGLLVLHVVRRDAPAQAAMVIGAAGSFAAIATLFGSPLSAAFLLMEAAGIGGPTLDIVMVPGLLAGGIGALIFVGLNDLTGFGTLSLAIPNIPHFGSPTGGEFLWAIAIGVAATVVGVLIRRMALVLQPIVERGMVVLTPVLGLAIAGLAILFFEISGKGSSQVLFSGQTALPQLIQQAATWSAGALLLLVLCKGLAYAISLSGFRGGPTFPGMFIGAAGGMALSHLAGLPMIAGVAMGIGAMTTVMLGLPLTAVLLTAVLLPTDAINLTPLVIVAAVVAYVGAARLAPTPTPAPTSTAPPAPPQPPVAAATSSPST